MKKALVITALLASMVSGEYHTGGYENNIIQYLSFDDSVLVEKESIRGAVIGGTTGAVQSESGPGNWIDFTLDYRYDSTENSVYVEGRGDKIIIELDEEKRPVKMKKGYVRTTTFQYGENETIIEVYPNTEEISGHSYRYTYRFNDNGDTTMMIRTGTDGVYGEPLVWAPEFSDTVTYSYDEEGKRSGISHITWTKDYNRRTRWKRHMDSLQYSYDIVDDETVQTLTQLSLSDTSWVSMREDTQYVSTLNDDGNVKYTYIRRWDSNNQEWDQTYFTKFEYDYDGQTLINHKATQFYGDGTSGLLIREVKLEYQRNNLKYGDIASEINDLTQSSYVSEARFSVASDNRVEFSGTANAIDQMSVYSMQGRLLRSVSGSDMISLEGISRGQALMVVASKAGQVVLTSKMVVQ